LGAAQHHMYHRINHDIRVRHDLGKHAPDDITPAVSTLPNYRGAGRCSFRRSNVSRGAVKAVYRSIGQMKLKILNYTLDRRCFIIARDNDCDLGLSRGTRLAAIFCCATAWGLIALALGEVRTRPSAPVEVEIGATWTQQNSGHPDLHSCLRWASSPQTSA
jgi:hypothetical protein